MLSKLVSVTSRMIRERSFLSSDMDCHNRLSVPPPSLGRRSSFRFLRPISSFPSNGSWPKGRLIKSIIEVPSFHLRLCNRTVKAGRFHQFIMCTNRTDLTAVKQQDTVGRFCCHHFLCHYDAGCIFILQRFPQS